MKKGRHRRFEEARKLKQSGPGAFDLGFGDRAGSPRPPPSTTRTTTTPPWPRSTASSSTTTTPTTTTERDRRRRQRRSAGCGSGHPARAAPAARPACRRRAGRPARRSRRATTVDGLGRRRTPRATRCTTSGTRRRPRPSRAASTRAAVTSGGRSRRCECSRRIGTCQHTFGFQSSGRSPASRAPMCRAHPAPPAKPGRLRKMQASSTRRVTVGGDAVVARLAGPQEPALAGLGVELHLLGAQPDERLDDVGDVVVVDEVGAVAAAALLPARAPARRGCPGTRRRRCSGSSSAGTWRRTPTSAARRGPRS